MSETPDRIEAIASALRAYGSAWRGDWANFDGRTLRDDMNEVAAVMCSDEPVTYESLCRQLGVCPVRRSWPEYCDERTDDRTYICVHMVEEDSTP